MALAFINSNVVPCLNFSLIHNNGPLEVKISELIPEPWKLFGGFMWSIAL